MTDEELDALVEELEAVLAAETGDVLAATVSEWADGIEAATELTAAAFSVRSIAAIWRRRVTPLFGRVRAIARRGLTVGSDLLNEPDVDEPTADDLLNEHVSQAAQQLEAVGDTLADLVGRELDRGLLAGEDRDELKARLLAAFGIGTDRFDYIRDRIAATEATRAFNHGVYTAAREASSRGLTVVRQWNTRRDRRVREAHGDADGQLRMHGEPFEVGGVPMLYPGDPAAPASLTVNCRCIMRTSVAEGNRNVGQNEVSADGSDAFRSNMPPQLKRYWLRGKGAAKIRWGTPGAFDRCVRNLRDDFPQNTEGLCANLYREATGRWPGSRKGKAAVEHNGAMVALMPTEEDAARLALDGGEDASELHLTLAYLGEADEWADQDREELTRRVADVAATMHPVTGRIFGGAHWNPDGDDPAWVWNVGDHEDPGTGLIGFREAVCAAFHDFETPVQHSPWVPHVCAAYGGGDRSAELATRVGLVAFDRVRVAFGGEYLDIPLAAFDPYEPEEDPYEPEEDMPAKAPAPALASWSTPGDTALAFEDQQTGDGRVFAPGALQWGPGPWPLMAKDTFASHDDAELAGAIFDLARDGNRIAASGVLYLNQEAGRDSYELLAQGAPLGVSVDLDDVDLEVVYAGEDADEPVHVASTRLVTASLMLSEGGGYVLRGITEPDITAASDDATVVLESASVVFHVGPDGVVPAAAFEVTAAAGDGGQGGTVLDTQRSGDHLMRITRARLRGATLVNLPAFEGARIVLDQVDAYGLAASDTMPDQVGDYDRVVRFARKHAAPVTAAEVAKFLSLSVVSVRRHLAKAVRKGDLVRLSRGKYVSAAQGASDGPATVSASQVPDDEPQTLTAAVTGGVDLPVADRDTEWDGDAAKDRVFTHADGDTSVIEKAFAYRDDEKDPADKAAYKLGYADVIGGELTIVPRGVAAARAAMNGARGGVDLPDDERGAVGRKLSDVQMHVDEMTGEGDMDEIEASAWTAMQDMPPMPAAWFAEPTAEELPPGGPGVNYANGRIFGWVAQAGEPHAGYARKLTIESLGHVDTAHFLRQRFTLDDGSVVRAGAFTMNAGHHRDGAECETSACQFDDSRTVAGIVTVGMNERGMWFSGAAAPWLSDWDRSVFMATQPSYHMKKGPGGWQLRAVLAVPVPGHSSPLMASAVVDRAQVALTAAAAMAPAAGQPEPEPEVQAQPQLDVVDYDKLADAIVAATARAEAKRASEEAELRALLEEGRKLGADETGTEGD